MNSSPFTYRIFANENIMVSKVQGVFTFEDMVSNIYILRADPNYTQGMNAIYDLKLCTNINGELNKLSEYGDLVNDNIAVPNKCRVAIVIPDNNEKIYRLAQGFVLITSESNIEHAVFTESNIHRAYRFVDCSPEMIVEIEK